MFGFRSRWINWIKECLSSVSYSILLNGNPYDFTVPTRGLRQGDPLSSFLFVISMEILSCLLDKAKSLSLIKGFCLTRSGPPITNLLFADNLIVFGQATLTEAKKPLIYVLICSLNGLVKLLMPINPPFLLLPIQIGHLLDLFVRWF